MKNPCDKELKPSGSPPVREPSWRQVPPALVRPADGSRPDEHLECNLVKRGESEGKTLCCSWIHDAKKLYDMYEIMSVCGFLKNKVAKFLISYAALDNEYRTHWCYRTQSKWLDGILKNHLINSVSDLLYMKWKSIIRWYLGFLLDAISMNLSKSFRLSVELIKSDDLAWILKENFV